MSKPNKFFVTFGQRYRHDPHPKVKYANPDGYLVINAKDMQQAREKVFAELGPYWAFIYGEKEFEEKKCYFPKGILHEIE